jgi:osmotically-inducible protein OsmY
MRATVSKTDAEIHKDVISELTWDPRVEETEVGVEVDQGVVTLTGTVGSWAKRRAAEDAAHRVFGVLDVANDVSVKVPGGLVRTDTEIAQSVRLALKWDAMVPDETIESTVANGEVTLTGVVQRWSQREDAERAVRNLVGVRRIVNRITIARSKANEHEIRRAIEGALGRRAQREAKRIDVDVALDTVTVSGTVDTWREHEAVLASARYTPGVREVVDRLRVNPYA